MPNAEATQLRTSLGPLIENCISEKDILGQRRRNSQAVSEN